MNNQINIGDRYKHYKRGLYYEIIGLAKDHETLALIVVYKALYGEGDLWVRPLEMFIEEVEHEGKLVPRFQLIEKYDE